MLWKALLLASVGLVALTWLGYPLLPRPHPSRASGRGSA